MPDEPDNKSDIISNDLSRSHKSKPKISFKKTALDEIPEKSVNFATKKEKAKTEKCDELPTIADYEPALMKKYEANKCEPAKILKQNPELKLSSDKSLNTFSNEKNDNDHYEQPLYTVETKKSPVSDVKFDARSSRYEELPPIQEYEPCELERTDIFSFDPINNQKKAKDLSQETFIDETRESQFVETNVLSTPSSAPFLSLQKVDVNFSKKGPKQSSKSEKNALKNIDSLGQNAPIEIKITEPEDVQTVPDEIKSYRRRKYDPMAYIPDEELTDNKSLSQLNASVEETKFSDEEQIKSSQSNTLRRLKYDPFAFIPDKEEKSVPTTDEIDLPKTQNEAHERDSSKAERKTYRRRKYDPLAYIPDEDEDIALDPQPAILVSCPQNDPFRYVPEKDDMTSVAKVDDYFEVKSKTCIFISNKSSKGFVV